MTEEKVISIEELMQDAHNFNKGTSGGGRIDGTLPQRAWRRPKYPD